MSAAQREAADRPGGHTHMVDVALDGIKYPADTGFLVYAATNNQVLLAEKPVTKNFLICSVAYRTPGAVSIKKRAKFAGHR
jgi:hypothetical protein